MEAEGMSTLRLYRRARPAMLFWLLPVVVLALASYMTTEPLNSQALADIAKAVAGVASFCMIGVFPAYVLIFQILRRPALTVTAHGMQLATTFLYWQEIAGMEIRPYAGDNHIFISLGDPVVFLSSRPNYVGEGYRRLFRQTDNCIVLPLVRGYTNALLIRNLQCRWTSAKDDSYGDPLVYPHQVFSPNVLAIAYGSTVLAILLFIQWFTIISCIQSKSASCISLHVSYAAAAGLTVYFAARVVIQLVLKKNSKFDLLEKSMAFHGFMSSVISHRPRS